VRIGIRGFTKTRWQRSASRHWFTPEGEFDPHNMLAEIKRDLESRLSSNNRSPQIEKARLDSSAAARAEGRAPWCDYGARVGIGVEEATTCCAGGSVAQHARSEGGGAAMTVSPDHR